MECSNKWLNPSDVLEVQKLKIKKKYLNSRIKGNSTTEDKASVFENVLCRRKRKIPFSNEAENKRNRSNLHSQNFDESSDQTLFKLFDKRISKESSNLTSFNNILNKCNGDLKEEPIEIVKVHGVKWLPIDWSLKSKLRLLSCKPFAWNSKLKLSEEASGITAFTRCLNKNSCTSLDDSPNAKFHKCCLYWQQPSLPWLKLFPRNISKMTDTTNIVNNHEIRECLQKAWFDSLRSAFQLLRTRQCPYFYVCANHFTVLFRAAGVCGYSDVHVLVSPTTRGFRKLLRAEDIDYNMPLKKKRISDLSSETMDTCGEVFEYECDDGNFHQEEENDDVWLKSMGVDDNEIKQIKYIQQKVLHKAECEVDNSEESLVLIEGTEVHSFYNFLLNFKSTIAVTGVLAGVPPTIISPVAFNGATLNSLKIRENRVTVDDINYFSLEVTGPILPTTIHNIFDIHSSEHSLTATFQNLPTTSSFSKAKSDESQKDKGGIIFVKENLSDCGLDTKILEHFCTADCEYVTNVECIKYDSDTKSYTWV